MIFPHCSALYPTSHDGMVWKKICSIFNNSHISFNNSFLNSVLLSVCSAINKPYLNIKFSSSALVFVFASFVSIGHATKYFVIRIA